LPLTEFYQYGSLSGGASEIWTRKMFAFYVRPPHYIKL